MMIDFFLSTFIRSTYRLSYVTDGKHFILGSLQLNHTQIWDRIRNYMLIVRILNTRPALFFCQRDSFSRFFPRNTASMTDTISSF